LLADWEVQYFVLLLFVMWLKWLSFITPAKFDYVKDMKEKKLSILHIFWLEPKTENLAQKKI
jgi:hypothetical protein